MYLSLNVPIQTFFQNLIQISAAKAKQVAKAVSTVLPSLKAPPKGINQEAQKRYWKEFVNKYKEVWDRYSEEPERAWACCVAIWTNYCLKRKVQPFNPSATQVNEDTREKLVERVISARKAQLALANSLLTRGVKKGLFSKFLKETFVSVNENKPGEYTILTRKYIKLEKGVEFNSAAFKDFLTKNSFRKRLSTYSRNVRANADVIIHLEPDTQKPAIYFKNVLTRSYAEIMLDVEHDKNNSDKIIPELIKAWKYVVRNVTGAVSNEQ